MHSTLIFWMLFAVGTFFADPILFLEILFGILLLVMIRSRR